MVQQDATKTIKRPLGHFKSIEASFSSDQKNGLQTHNTYACFYLRKERSTSLVGVRPQALSASFQRISKFTALMNARVVASVCIFIALSVASEATVRSSGSDISKQDGVLTTKRNKVDYKPCSNKQLSLIYKPYRFVQYFCSSSVSSSVQRLSLFEGENSSGGMKCQKVPITNLSDRYRRELVRAEFLIIFLVDASSLINLKRANFLSSALICGNLPIPPPGASPPPAKRPRAFCGEDCYCCMVCCYRYVEKCKCKCCCKKKNWKNEFRN